MSFLRRIEQPGTPAHQFKVFEGQREAMYLTQIAEQYRVNIRRDECGDSIIPGKRGHLYLDGDQICGMWPDTRPMNRSRLMELGGTLWQGDISDGVQDAWVKGIAPDKIRQALRMVGAKPRRVMSEARRAVLEKARAASPLERLRAGTQRHAVESLAGAGVTPEEGCA
jgi:hypothetical protein